MTNRTMFKALARPLAGLLLAGSLVQAADACSRFTYATADGNYIVGRSMDWAEDLHTDLWAFPRAMVRDGNAGPNSVKWTSKYGSVVASAYDSASADGMNEAGLAGNLLYLAEADYGDASTSAKPKMSIGAWLQYALDNFATVDEAVAALSSDPFVINAPVLPNGKAASGHLALTDAGGDVAIFEYIGGKLKVHHDRKYVVMTNSPPFDEQLAINTYWKDVGGLAFLPGTARASDRFVRLSWNLNAAPKAKDPVIGVAVAFSLIRTVSVPLGLSDPDKPNIASTLWRTVADTRAKRYYFDSSVTPNVFWVDIGKLNLAPGAKPSKLELETRPILAGEVSAQFVPAAPFVFMNH